MAEDLKGWKGIREIKSIGGDICLSATTDSLGHIYIIVELMDSPVDADWHVAGTLMIEASSLAKLAKSAKKFFNCNSCVNQHLSATGKSASILSQRLTHDIKPGNRLMKYENHRETAKEEIKRIIIRNDPEELIYMVVSVGLFEEDYDFAYKIVFKLSCHPDHKVRGNAILCFGYLARRFRKLPEEQVKPIIELALKEKKGFIYDQAWAAATDIQEFLGWPISGFGREASV
jgi:hypothetical protein